MKTWIHTSALALLIAACLALAAMAAHTSETTLAYGPWVDPYGSPHASAVAV